MKLPSPQRGRWLQMNGWRENMQAFVAATLSFAAAAGSGCGKQTAPSGDTDTNSSRLSLTTLVGEPSKIQLRELVQKLKRSLDDVDLDEARAVAQKIDRMLNQRVAGWYVDILKVEQREGVTAARTLLSQLRDSETANDEERKALEVLDTYFQKKGNPKTGEVFEVLLRFYLEEEIKGLRDILPHQ